MRTYLKTHPWITFKCDLSQAPPLLWLMLGECQSKCEHLIKTPLRPQTAQELNQLYLAKGVQGSAAIEGNTLTEAQVLDHIHGKLKLPPSTEYLQQEIANVIDACTEITDHVAAGSLPTLSVERIKELNKKVLQSLQCEKEVVPGEFRHYSVGVGNVYRGAPAEDCDYLMDTLTEWLTGDDFKAPASMGCYGFVFGILRAVIAHLYLVWIHPFGDGNGRTARLLEYEILNASGIPSPATHLLSNHYNLTRTEYYRQLAHASQFGGDVLPFIEYAVQGFLDGLREYMEKVWEQNYDVVWRSYVHQKFHGKTRPADLRRRSLVFALTKAGGTEKAQIPMLSMELMQSYGALTTKTLERDLAELISLGLIVHEENKYRARTEEILTYLPFPARKT